MYSSCYNYTNGYTSINATLNASQNEEVSNANDHSFSFMNFTNAFLCTRPAYWPSWSTHRYRSPSFVKHW